MKLTPGGGVLARGRVAFAVLMMGRDGATSCLTSTFSYSNILRYWPIKKNIPKTVNPIPQKKKSWGRMLYS